MRHVVVQAVDALTITGNSGIAANKRIVGDGGGDITLSADNITLADGGYINSDTSTFGNGGNISIDAAGALAITGGEITASSLPWGELCGSISPGEEMPATSQFTRVALRLPMAVASVQTPQRRAIVEMSRLRSQARLRSMGLPAESARVDSALIPFLGTTGNGGQVTVRAESITLADSGYIRTDTMGGGNGGNIVVEATGALAIAGGQISATSIPLGSILRGRLRCWPNHREG